MIDLIYAHPYPHRSRANRALLDAVRDLPGVEVRSLYDLYPDFAIDVEAEQDALSRAEIVVWQHPLYWYSVPALLKHWFEKVLAHGWAYGEGGRALPASAACGSSRPAATRPAYTPAGMHGHPFESFVPPIAQTARFCGMSWLDPPIVLHGAHRIDDDGARSARGSRYRARLVGARAKARSRRRSRHG